MNTIENTNSADRTKNLVDIRDINTACAEGKYLTMALSRLTTTVDSDKTPYEVLEILTALKESTYDNPPHKVCEGLAGEDPVN